MKFGKGSCKSKNAAGDVSRRFRLWRDHSVQTDDFMMYDMIKMELEDGFRNQLDINLLAVLRKADKMSSFAERIQMLTDDGWAERIYQAC